MARYDFGGTLADFVVTSHRLGTLDTLALSAATLTMWSAQSGGTRYTDLVLNGSAVSSISVGTDGQVPKFQGPDGVTEMWADGGSSRIRIVTLQGAPGPAGKDGINGANGLPGVNAVPADSAVAGYVTGPSATQTALSALTDQPSVDRRLYVSKAGSDSNNGRSAAKAFLTIGAAVAALGGNAGSIFAGIGTFTEDPLVMQSRQQLIGSGSGVTVVKPKSGATLPLLSIPETAPSVYMQVRDIEFTGLGATNPNQHGLYFTGSSDTGAGSGLWWSIFKNVTVGNFDGHAMWLRGGPSTFMRPHQNLIFENVVLYASGTTHYALMVSGQVGQIDFINGYVSGPSGQTASNATTPIAMRMSSTCSDDFGNVVTSSTSPYSITFHNFTVQSAKLGAQITDATRIRFEGACHFESLASGLLVDGGAEVFSDGSSLSNSASNGLGTGFALKTNGAASQLVAKHSRFGGTTDKTYVRAAGYLLAADDSDTATDYRGTGLTVQVATSATLAFNGETALVNGDAGATPITTITSRRPTGSRLTLRCFGGTSFSLATGGNIDLGGNASPLVVPAGAAVILQRFDLGSTWQVVALTKPPSSGGAVTLVGCRANTAASTSIPTGTVTAIPFELEEYDTDGFHDTATANTRLTIPAGLGGKYQISATAVIGSQGTGRRVIRIQKNGNGHSVARDDRNAVSAASAPTSVNISTELTLAAGDYFEVFVFQDSGTTLTLDGSSLYSAADTLISGFVTLRKVS